MKPREGRKSQKSRTWRPSGAIGSWVIRFQGLAPLAIDQRRSAANTRAVLLLES